MAALTLDDIVTRPLADQLRRLLADQKCWCPDCMTIRTRVCDAILDRWLERTRGSG